MDNDEHPRGRTLEDLANAWSIDDDQIFNGDLDSPNDMLVDSEDFLNDAEGEKDDGDVAIINPDEALPRADDCKSFPCVPAREPAT